MIISGQNKQKLWALLFILVVTFLTLSPLLGNHFTNWDDGALLTGNSEVHDLSLESWQAIFTKNYVGTYIPLTILSFNLEYALFHDNPFFYYLDNLLLHLAVVALVFVFAQRLGLSLAASGCAALLFGIHPMHVESVGWVSQRKDVLYSLFYMLALLQYWSFLEQGKKRSYGWALGFALFSILAKPMAYSLPVILLLCDWWKGKAINAKTVVEKVPFFILIGGVSLITYSSNSQASVLTFAQTLLVWAWVFIFHLQKFFFPYGLIPAYEMPQQVSLGNPEYALALAVFGLFVGLAYLFRRQKWFWFAFLFYFISNSMIIFRAAWEFGNNTVTADRFMYLPSLGICLVLGVCYDHFKNDQRIRVVFPIFCSLIFVSLILLCSAQTWVWKNNISLWSHVLQYYPHRVLAYQNRAAGYAEAGLYKLAMKDLDHALTLEPGSATLYFCRADIFEKKGDLQSALNDLDHAIMLNAEDANFYFRRGKIYQDLRQNDKALLDYGRAITKNPDFDRALYNRGIIFDEAGKADLALADYAQVIRINPRHAKVYNNRAVVYINLKEYEKAQDDLLKAIKIGSRNSQAYGNLGIVAFVKQDYPLAVKYLEQAIAIDTNNKEARNLLMHIKGE